MAEIFRVPFLPDLEIDLIEVWRQKLINESAGPALDLSRVDKALWIATLGVVVGATLLPTAGSPEGTGEAPAHSPPR